MTSVQPMSRLILTYGAVLTVIGAGTVAIAGLTHWTALIPAILGVVVMLIAAGLLSRIYRAKVAGLLSLTVAALALTGTLSAIPRLPEVVNGTAGNPEAIAARAITAFASILFVAVLAWRFRRPGT